MSDHILDLLGAYLDGELYGGQLRKVETHLEECSSCMEEFQALQSLSMTLHEALAPSLPSSDRFAADVVLRLPRKTVKPLRRKVLEVGWWMAPVGLLAAWIFLGTTILVSNLLTAASDFGLLSGASAWLTSAANGGTDLSTLLGSFGLLGNGNLQWFAASESFTRTILASVFWQVSIAILYLSWIAIWWTHHMRQGLGKPFDSGSRSTVK